MKGDIWSKVMSFRLTAATQAIRRLFEMLSICGPWLFLQVGNLKNLAPWLIFSPFPLLDLLLQPFTQQDRTIFRDKKTTRPTQQTHVNAPQPLPQDTCKMADNSIRMLMLRQLTETEFKA